MTHVRGPAAILLGLILAACAGPSPSAEPSIRATPPTPTPTISATIATPSVAPSATPTPTTDLPGTPSPTPPPGTPTPLGWLQRTDVAAGPIAREDHTWTANGDGTIAYLFGGRGTGGASNELWTFDLATDSWSQLRQTVDTPIPEPRFGHTATWVPDVGLVIWSGQGNSGFFDDIWAWNTATNSWLELASLGAVPAARYGSCASLGPDGELWISHGFTADTGRFADTRSYDFETGVWTDRTPVDRVPVERCLHDCFWSSLSGHLILYGGQTTGVAALGDAWAYDPVAGVWIRGPDSDAPPRQLYSLSTLAGQGFVFGGGSLERGFLDDSWLIGPNLELVPLEANASPPPRSGATLIHGGDRHLLFGGRNAEGELADLWELPRIP